MKRCNLTFKENQFKCIERNAKAADLKTATWIKYVALQAAGILFNPDTVILPKRIKQTNLFERGEK
jgi:hypothetical protein